MIARFFTGLVTSLLCATPLFAASIQGTVVNNTTNQPIAGARVVLVSATQSGGTAMRDTVISTSTGAFVFSALAAGNYTLNATAQGFLARQPQSLFVQTATDSLTRTLRLTPEGGVTPQRFGTIASTVTDTLSGKAIADAKVVLSRQGQRLDSALTNGQGIASFDSLPVTQNYRLSFSAEGYVSKSMMGISVVADSTTAVSAALALKPLPQGVVEGTVIDGVSKDSLAGVQVYLRLDTLSSGTGWKILDSVLTDAQGSYRFGGLEVSTLQRPYSVRVVKEGYRSASSSSIALVDPTDTVNVPFALIPILPTTLSVFVADETTESLLSGVSISIVNAEATAYTATTAANGWAHFSAIDAGTYSITATLSGYMIGSGSHRVSAETQDSISLSLEPIAEDSKTLSGTIRDNKGAPVANAVVTVNLERTNRPALVLTTTTGSDGRYTLSGIDAIYTRASISVQKEGLNTLATSVTLVAGVTALDLVLETTVSTQAIQSATQGALQVQLLSSNGLVTLQVVNAPAGAILKAYTVNGRQAISQRLQAGRSTLALPSAAAASGSPLVVMIQHEGQTFWKHLLVR